MAGLTEADLDAARTRRWLWLFDHAGDTERLFDLQADAGATHDLLADTALPEKARKDARAQADSLKAAFAEWERQTLLSSAPAAEPVERTQPCAARWARRCWPSTWVARTSARRWSRPTGP